MIKIENLCKYFDNFKALDNMSLHVKKGSVYGLVGINGAGKTTIIKHLAGVYKQDSGKVMINDNTIYDNIAIKNRIGYITDDLYFFNNYTMNNHKNMLKNLYSTWNEERYKNLVALLGLNPKKRLHDFSKGMQKQAAFIFALAIMPDVMLLDEPLDGLDPLMRKLVVKEILKDVAEREMTVLISSHNLKEIEGICDSVGIMKNGKMIIEKDIDDLKSDTHKIQILVDDKEREKLKEELQVLYAEQRGSVDILIVKGNRDKINDIVKKFNPLLFDILPLSLEEIFIYETDGEIFENTNK